MKPVLSSSLIDNFNHQMAKHKEKTIRALQPFLKGQVLHVPDLRPAFAQWKQGVNINYEQLIPAVDAQLEAFCDNENMVEKGKAVNFAFFASR